MGYFGLANQLKLFAQLDGWIRRRVRMCYWKQWRRPKRRRQMLIRLGVPARQAIRHARSRKSYWHMGRTCSTSSNHVVRTRTLRGVGRAVRNGGPYPISSGRSTAGIDDYL